MHNATSDFESDMYTNSNTPAYGAGNGTRTRNDFSTDFKSVAFTDLAMPAYGGSSRVRTVDDPVMSRELCQLS